MGQIDAFGFETLQAICNALGDTEHGLSGREIGQYLARVGIHDPTPSITKRYRLFNALQERQRQDRCGNNVVAFIRAAMNPVSYTNQRDRYHRMRDELNVALAFAGLQLGEDGKLRRSRPVRTLTEAQRRARSLQKKLRERGVHPDILRFCKAELVEENYFHAVFEATKSVADKIRTKANLEGDGARLVDDAFSLGKSGVPVLAINRLHTETEESEQRGFAFLLKGLFGTFRNPLAHEPRIRWNMDESDALDLFSLASLCHRRIDAAVNIASMYKTGDD